MGSVTAAPATRLWRRAVRECERWHQRVLMLDDERFIQAKAKMVKFHAPQHDAFITNERELVWNELEISDGSMAPCGLIHELAHVLIWIACGQRPDVACESGPMLAIEHEASRRLRLPWSKWMAGYGAPNGEDWPDCSVKERSALLTDAYIEAEICGLMKHGRPTYRLPKSASE